MKLTDETIIATRQHFTDIHQSCIDGAKAGEFHVNDLDRYIAQQEEAISKLLAGEWDNTFSFLQKAHWIQTGDCIPFLA